jgi:hypothetical protein
LLFFGLVLRRYSPPDDRFAITKPMPELRNVTMKRIVSALIASAALLVVFSGVANAADQSSSNPPPCQGPKNFCNVFFGQ